MCVIWLIRNCIFNVIKNKEEESGITNLLNSYIYMSPMRIVRASVITTLSTVYPHTSCKRDRVCAHTHTYIYIYIKVVIHEIISCWKGWKFDFQKLARASVA